MKHWVKDAVSAAMAVRAARKAGIDGKLVIMEEDEVKAQSELLEDIKADNQTMQMCIRESAVNSPCQYCEDYDDCKKEGRDTSKACDGWWLMFNRAPKGGQS